MEPSRCADLSRLGHTCPTWTPCCHSSTRRKARECAATSWSAKRIRYASTFHIKCVNCSTHMPYPANWNCAPALATPIQTTIRNGWRRGWRLCCRSNNFVCFALLFFAALRMIGECGDTRMGQVPLLLQITYEARIGYGRGLPPPWLLMLARVLVSRAKE